MPRSINLGGERARLEALRALELLDTPPEAEFDAIVAGAQHLFGCKMAYVSLIDAERQWFKARCGIAVSETSRDISFCDHTVATDDMLVIPDALHDNRFAGSPLVLGPPFIRFYAGVPLRVRGQEGSVRLPIGTLCVADDHPHDPSPDKLIMLKGMARVIEAILETRRLSRESLRLALERQDALDEMARAQRLLQHAERMARIGSWRLELATGHVHWSDQTYAIHGVEPGLEERLNTALHFYPEEDRAKLEAALVECAEQGKPWDLELDLTDARGQLRRVRTLGEVDQRAGERVAIMGVIQDISDRYRFERRLHEVARTDELTGIPSRRAFNEELDFALVEARKGGDPFAIAIVDLDRFKEVNDRLGHAAGDEVLRLMAAKLQSIRYLGHHFIARLGGDEFVLLLRGKHAEGGLVASIEQLLLELRHQVPADDCSILVSATIGACAYDANHPNRATLLKCADDALYRAKGIRRGTGAVAGREDHIEPAPTSPSDAVAAH
jgi:diguanylate cyclase (GGDEF)-like protein